MSYVRGQKKRPDHIVGAYLSTPPVRGSLRARRPVPKPASDAGTAERPHDRGGSSRRDATHERPRGASGPGGCGVVQATPAL